MASIFYIVHHHLKPGMAGEWLGKTGAPMSDETVFAQNIKTTMEKGFFNHVHEDAVFVFHKSGDKFSKTSRHPCLQL